MQGISINHSRGINDETKISPAAKNQQKYEKHQNIELRTNRFMFYFGIFSENFMIFWV